MGQYARQWDSPRGSLAGVTSATLPRSRSPSGPHTSLARTRTSNTTSPLARDNSQANIANKIRTQKVRTFTQTRVWMMLMTLQMSKEDLLLPARSESSCSQLSLSATESSNISPDTLRLSGETLCDTSSEVSDEGYKSSQGNSGVTSKTEVEVASLEVEGERPESSMTVGSDCSSTISTEDEERTDQDGSSSLTVIAASPVRK